MNVYSNDIEKIVRLVSSGELTLDKYLKDKDEFFLKNKNYHLYEINNREFGEQWGEKFLLQNVKGLQKSFTNEYDLFYKNLKIEIKASRATNNSIKNVSLAEKSLKFNDKKSKYWLNFQQIKFNFADIFIFIGVWLDETKLWCFTSEELRELNLSNQHRLGNEYQLHIKQNNIHKYKNFEVKLENLLDYLEKINGIENN